VGTGSREENAINKNSGPFAISEKLEKALIPRPRMPPPAMTRVAEAAEVSNLSGKEPVIRRRNSPGGFIRVSDQQRYGRSRRSPASAASQA
jgi:hypothetical protein